MYLLNLYMSKAIAEKLNTFQLYGQMSDKKICKSKKLMGEAELADTSVDV